MHTQTSITQANKCTSSEAIGISGFGAKYASNPRSSIFSTNVRESAFLSIGVAQSLGLNNRNFGHEIACNSLFVLFLEKSTIYLLHDMLKWMQIVTDVCPD
jgi:hypothetical protein